MITPATTIEQDQLEAARYYRWHITHRGACHGASGPRCECICGCKHHKGENAPFESPEIRALLDAEAAVVRRHVTERVNGPRRHRRQKTQLRLLI